MGFVKLKATVVAVIACALSANAIIPNYASPAEANADFDRRLAEIVKGQVSRFKIQRESPAGIGTWSERTHYGLREFAAGMYVFANPSNFSEKDFAALSGLNSVSRVQHRDEFLKKLNEFSKTISVIHPVGTEFASEFSTDVNNVPSRDSRFIENQPWHPSNNMWYYSEADYDMSLREIVTIVYAFVDRPDVLPNEVLSRMLIQNTRENTIPYTGQEINQLSVYMKSYNNSTFGADVNVKIKQPETENHLLMIYQWKYLVNNLVRWIAELPASHPRYNLEIKKYYDLNPSQYKNSESLTNWMISMLSRVNRRGLFETNARAYESLSFNAVISLAANADLLLKDDMLCKKVGVAARNAADYLAANHVFLSMKGKRNLSRRRNWQATYYDVVSLYSNNYMPNMMGVLTGSYSFDDKGVVDDGECPSAAPYCIKALGKNQPSGFALMAGISGYRVPDVLIKYALHPSAGWEATSQTSYGRVEYDPNSNWCFTTTPGGKAFIVTTGVLLPLLFGTCPSGNPDDPDWKYPNYGEQSASDIFKVKNRVTVTENYAVASGGIADIYLKQTTPIGTHEKALEKLNTITTPYYLIPKGDVGHWQSIDFARSEAIVGSSSEPFRFASNMQTYKALAVMPASNLFTFSTDKKYPEFEGAIDWSKVKAPTDWTLKSREKSSLTLQPGMLYRIVWDQGVPSARLYIPAPEIKIFDLTSSDVAPSVGGNYLVLGRHGNIGFWDLIPKAMIDKFGFAAVENVIKQSKGVRLGETADRLDFQFQYSRPMVVGDCSTNCSLSSNVIVLGQSGDQTAAILNSIPGDNGPADRNNFPLLEANELNEFQTFTGRKIAESPEVGLLKINDFSTGQTLMIDTRNRNNPTSNATRIQRKLKWGVNLTPILQLLLD